MRIDCGYVYDDDGTRCGYVERAAGAPLFGRTPTEPSEDDWKAARGPHWAGWYSAGEDRADVALFSHFDTMGEAARNVVSACQLARMPDIFTGASASPAASLAPGVCGVCARIGTNDVGGPTAHAPGCPNG